MQSLIIDTAPIPKNPSTAHSRNAIIMSEELGIDLISTVKDLVGKDPKEYNQYIIVGSAFYDKTAEIEFFIRKSKNPRIVWVNNEYSCSPNSEYARLMKDYESLVISNVVENANKVKGYNNFELINLNTLIVRPKYKQIAKKYNMLYWGTYRAARRIYLQKYFGGLDDFILSSSTRNLRKFNQLAGCRSKFCSKLDWTAGREQLNLVSNTIYIEDEFTHTSYNHLANRFYESIFCNVVQFFDKSCVNTLEESGYTIDKKFIVSTKQELMDKLSINDYANNIQKQDWGKQALREKYQTIQKLKECLNN